MKKETSLCMGCMAEAKDEFGEKLNICAVCGYTANSVFLSSYLAPTTFLADRYIIGKLISYNGEGAYYIAYDTVNNVKVTVREYMPDTLCGRKKEAEAIEVNPQFVALYKTYLSEFIELNRSLMSTGSSLQIQRVLDVFTENSTAYAVYEYITGVSLKSYLSNLGGVLPWEQVKELFAPLFSTLGVIHAAGIIHRGISPSTILLNDKSELVLINFGITAARTFGSEINYEIFAGYAAPEQYCGKERHGSCTDIYGVSAVLYKVLTGQMPASATSRKEDAFLTEPALLNRNVPVSVSAAIMKGLTLDVDGRTQTIGKFIDGLFEAVPVSVPDSTDEILIKKPPRIAEIREARQHSGSQGRSSKKSGSYVMPVIALTLLSIVVIATIVVMLNPDLVESWRGNGGEVTTTPADTGNIPPIEPPPNGITEPPVTGDDPTQTQPNEPTFAVPDFTTRRFELVENSGTFWFLAFTPVYEFSDEHSKGVIIEQDIPQGTEVTSGTSITVIISRGPKEVPLPAYEGIAFDDYIRLLENASIMHNGHTGEYSDTVEEGLVIRCVIGTKAVTAGDSISIENRETVKVFYSLGSEPEPEPEPEPESEPDPDPAPEDDD